MATKKKNDMSVFDRMISGNGSESEQLPGQMDISDFTGASTEEQPAAEEQQLLQGVNVTQKPEKKSFCFRAYPEQIQRWKIFAAVNEIKLEQLCVTALDNITIPGGTVRTLENEKANNIAGGEDYDLQIGIKMTAQGKKFLSWYAKQGGITLEEQIRQLIDIKIREEYFKWETDYKTDISKGKK